MRLLHLLVGVAATGLTGCATHLSTLPDRDRTASPSEAVVGAPYSLPMLQYKTAITRSLVRCPTTHDLILPDGSKLTLSDAALSFKVMPAAEARYIAGERYVVDYRALGSPMKVSAFTMETYSSGVLKSINVAADDQSAEVVKQTVKTALVIGTMAAGRPDVAMSSTLLPAIAADAGADTTKAAKAARAAKAVIASKGLQGRVTSLQIVQCTPLAMELVSRLALNGTAREKAAATLERANAEVTRLTLVAGLRAAGRADAKALLGAMKAQADATAALAEFDEARKTLEKRLADTTTAHWPRDFKTTGADVSSLPMSTDAADKFAKLLVVNPSANIIKPEALKAWLDSPEAAPFAASFRKKNKEILDRYYLDEVGGPRSFNPPPAVCGPNADVAQCLALRLNLFGKLQRAATGMADCAAGATVAECVREVPIQEIDEDGGAGGKGDPARPWGRQARDGVADRGLFIRPPAEGEAMIYRNTGDAAKPTETVLALGVVAAPQLGQLRYLPFSNGAFESNVLALSLREDGSPEKFEYKESRAVAAAMTASAADALTQVQAWRKEQTDLVKTARQDEIAEIQFQIDSLKKQKELLDLQTPATVDAMAAIKDETARLVTETAFLNAQLAKLKAEAALTAPVNP